RPERPPPRPPGLESRGKADSGCGEEADRIAAQDRRYAARLHRPPREGKSRHREEARGRPCPLPRSARETHGAEALAAPIISGGRAHAAVARLERQLEFRI